MLYLECTVRTVEQTRPNDAFSWEGGKCHGRLVLSISESRDEASTCALSQCVEWKRAVCIDCAEIRILIVVQL